MSASYFNFLISNTEMRNMYTESGYFPQHEVMPCSSNSMEVISASAEARMDYLIMTNCHHHFALAGRITDSSFLLRIKTQITFSMNKTCCPTER